MSQDRYHRPEGLNTGSLGVSLALTGAMIAGLVFAAPHVTGPAPETHLVVRNIDVPAPPPPDPKPLPKTQTTQPQIVTPKPEVETTLLLHPMADPTPLPYNPIPESTSGPIASASSTAAPTASVPLPVLVDAAVDPRYAAALQPPYPAEERRAQHEGRVVVRVLIGVDGRVKQVERKSADSDAFYRETERQALTKWRFRPATRDGIPVEAWRTMAIRFVLQGD